MPAYDLHSHTTASDGTLTPQALVNAACKAGVDVLAITDHDSTAGLEEAHRAAQNLPLNVIDGCEISVTWSGSTVHIVGLNLDLAHQPLQQGLARLREHRKERARAIAADLEKHGIGGIYEKVVARVRGGLISRTHFAHELVALGKAASVREVFKKYLVRGKPGFVAGQWAQLEEAVDWITAAGGQAVIAHPARYRLTRSKLIRLIEAFRGCGGEAIEVVSGSHSRDESFTMARHARDFGLLASAGSDYHGPENPWVSLGDLPQLPQGCEPIWSSWQR